jgi:septum formation protein
MNPNTNFLCTSKYGEKSVTVEHDKASGAQCLHPLSLASLSMPPSRYIQLFISLLSSLPTKGFTSSLARRRHKFLPTRSAPTFVARPMSDQSTSTAAASDAAGVGVGPSRTDPLQQLGLPSPLILGSASFTRKLILKEMGIPFRIVVRPIDEQSLGDRSLDPPHELVMNLATAKMEHLVREIRAGRCDDELPDRPCPESEVGVSQQEYVVLTGDQVVTCNGDILEKPRSVEEAREMVSRYATHPPSTVGSVVLTHLPSGHQVSGVDTATIHFAPTISGGLVDRLLEDGNAPVLSCAGGLMVEHPKVREHLVRIEGTEDSVMGLSKDLVVRLLSELAQSLERPSA